MVPPYPPLPNDFVIFYARFTCNMKNFVDLMPIDPANSDSNGRVRSGLHVPDIGKKIAELNLCVPGITMNVIDAITCLVENGPAGDAAVFTDANMVIASKDRVAADSVGLALLKYKAKEVGVLGIGTADPSEIRILSSGVRDIRKIKNKWV